MFTIRMQSSTALCATLVLAACLLSATGCEPTRSHNVDSVALRVEHLRFSDFKEEHNVHIGERFYLGDSEYSAEVADFVADFKMNPDTKKVVSSSDQLNNPGVQIVLYKGSREVYKTWVLRDFPAYHTILDPGFVFFIDKLHMKQGYEGGGEAKKQQKSSK